MKAYVHDQEVIVLVDKSALYQDPFGTHKKCQQIAEDYYQQLGYDNSAKVLSNSGLGFIQTPPLETLEPSSAPEIKPEITHEVDSEEMLGTWTMLAK